jgi:hypothetical protein
MLAVVDSWIFWTKSSLQKAVTLDWLSSKIHSRILWACWWNGVGFASFWLGTLRRLHCNPCYSTSISWWRCRLCMALLGYIDCPFIRGFTLVLARWQLVSSLPAGSSYTFLPFEQTTNSLFRLLSFRTSVLCSSGNRFEPCSSRRL